MKQFSRVCGSMGQTASSLLMTGQSSLYPRHLEKNVRAALEDTPVVCVLGPRQSGKTTLVQNLEPGRAFVSLERKEDYQYAREDPDGFVGGLPEFVTLDEVQRAPRLLNAIKLSVDRNRRPGRFLLTGSANLLLLPTISESLAGREDTVHLLPLTEAEKERQPGRFLSALLDDAIRTAIRGERQNEPPTFPERLVAGGYPTALLRTPERARQWHRRYLETVIRRDVKEIARIHDTDRLALLLRLLAVRDGHLLNVNKLSRQLRANRVTIDHYLSVLQRLFLIRTLPAWRPGEAARLTATPKLHLLDSGLAATLAKLTAAGCQRRRERFGHLLESFVVQQLIAQAAWTDPDLEFWHYRERDLAEVDIVMTLGDQVWGFEVKSAASLSDRDGQGLSLLAERSGAGFRRGIVFYAGSNIRALRDKRMLAVPLSELWAR